MLSNIGRKVAFLYYHIIAKRLPNSGSPIFGNISKSQRAFCVKRMIEYCGSNINVEPHAAFGMHCEIGNNSGIGRDSRLDGKVVLGDNVMMGRECLFFALNHAFSRTDIPMNKQGYSEEKPIYVGNDVWLGSRVIVLGGVHIGDGCVIGAGSVVTKDIPPFSVAVGNPARVVKTRI